MSIQESMKERIFTVAEKMKDAVKLDPSRYLITPNEAYVLGLLHDVGYAFTDSQDDHASKGGDILMGLGYINFREVYFHGRVQEDFDSEELRLLNYVDMTTGPCGEDFTIQDKLTSIECLHGVDSDYYKSALAIAKTLENFNVNPNF